MERRAFQTPLGEVWLWGEADAFDGERPVVLVIHGAFEDEHTLWFNLPPHMPAAAVLLAHLPGNHCPELSELGVQAYAEALAAVIREAWPGRPVIACGVSVGALVALALSGSVAAIVAVEPPLKPPACWPLLWSFRYRAYNPWAEPWVTQFVREVFGYLPRHVEDRDYTSLLADLTCPCTIALGSEPLMPRRAFDQLPSLVDEPERALLRTLPGVTVLEAKGAGHNVPRTHDRLIVEALGAYVVALT